MTLNKSKEPSIVKDGKSRAGGSRLAELTEIQTDGEAGEWYVLGTWDNQATASKFARGLSRAGTDKAKPSDPKCPPGRWAAGVEKLDDGTAEVRVRYLGDEATEEDPFG